jgi:rubredoxin
MKLLAFDKIPLDIKMKIAYPCPVCGEVILANKCKSCGYEFMPETPKPKMKPETKKKPKKPRKGRFLRF